MEIIYTYLAMFLVVMHKLFLKDETCKKMFELEKNTLLKLLESVLKFTCSICQADNISIFQYDFLLW